jgi:hypothetical protein
MSAKAINRLFSFVFFNSTIVICWIAYHFYQPFLFEKYHLQEASYFFNISQPLIFLLIPPISGIIADRFFAEGSNNFLVFTVGVAAASLLFFISAFVFLDSTPMFLKKLIPVAMIFWLIAMNLFYTPAADFVVSKAKKDELLIVMASISCSTNLLYVLSDQLVNLVVVFGSVLTFFGAGIVLLLSAYIFFKNISKSSSSDGFVDFKKKNNFEIVVLIGLCCGFLESVVKELLGNSTFVFFQMGSELLYGLAVSIFVIPVTLLMPKNKMRETVIWTFLSSALFLVFYYLFAGNTFFNLLLILLLSLSASILSVIVLPYALNFSQNKHSNLSCGLFLASFALPAICFEFFKS